MLAFRPLILQHSITVGRVRRSGKIEPLHAVLDTNTYRGVIQEGDTRQICGETLAELKRSCLPVPRWNRSSTTSGTFTIAARLTTLHSTQQTPFAEFLKNLFPVLLPFSARPTPIGAPARNLLIFRRTLQMQCWTAATWANVREAILLFEISLLPGWKLQNW